MNSSNNYSSDKQSSVANYIPYACHYNYQTILTKNGELLIVVKLEHYYDEQYRVIIANLFAKYKQLSYAIWTTSINKKNDVHFRQSINKNHQVLQEIMQDSFDFKKNTDNFQSEIFISFVFSDKIGISDFRSSWKFLFNFDSRKYKKRLQDLYLQAKKIVDRFVFELRSYQAKILSIKKNQATDEYYCEILNFLSQINFIPSEAYIPIDTIDLSLYLGLINNVDFNILHNIIKIVNKKNEQNKYHAMFYIKSLQSSSFNVDLGKDILSNEFEFISTEVLLHFNNSINLNIDDREVQNYQKFYQAQKEYLQISENNQFFNQILHDDQKNLKNKNVYMQKLFLKRNILSVCAENLDELNLNIKRIYQKFNKYGIKIVRESVFIDQLFWAQLPANFAFLDKFNITYAQNILMFNSFDGQMNDWKNCLIFKEKITRKVFHLYLKQNKILFTYTMNQESNFCIIFLLMLVWSYNSNIYYFDYKTSLIKIFQKFNQNNENLGAVDLGGSISINDIQDNNQKIIFSNKAQLSQILFKIFSLINLITKIDEPLQQEQINDLILNLEQNIVLNCDLLTIINIIEQFRLIDQNFLDKIKLINNFFPLDSNLNYLQYPSQDPVISLLSTLIHIIKVILMQQIAPEDVQNNLDHIFVIRHNQLFIDHDLHMIIGIVEKFQEILSKFNIYLIVEIITSQPAILSSLKNLLDNSELIVFSSNEGAKQLCNFLNPGITHQNTIFNDCLLINQKDKFIFNEFIVSNFLQKIKNFL